VEAQGVGGELLVLGEAGRVVVVQEQDDQAEKKRRKGSSHFDLSLPEATRSSILHGSDGAPRWSLNSPFSSCWMIRGWDQDATRSLPRAWSVAARALRIAASSVSVSRPSRA